MVFPGAVPPDLGGVVSPLPGIVTFPYVTIHVGALLGAPPGAVRVDGNPPLPPGAVVAGDFVVDTATPRVGTDLLIIPRCAQPGDDLPPAPPTAAEIWEQTPLPRATVHANPPGTRAWPGIVNLESRFWGDPLPDARATVALRGYIVTVVAHPVAYAWSFGDGTTSVSGGPGGPDGAGARRVPATRRLRRRPLRGVGGAGAHPRTGLGPRLRYAVPRYRHPARAGRLPRGRDPGPPPVADGTRVASPEPGREGPGTARRRRRRQRCSGRSWWGPTGRWARRRPCWRRPSWRPPSPTRCSTSSPCRSRSRRPPSPPPRWPPPHRSPPSASWEAEIRTELEQTLGRAADTAGRAGDTRIETHARFGSPAEVLCDMADAPPGRPHRGRQPRHAGRPPLPRQRAQHGVAPRAVQRADRRHHRRLADP